jgi:hypothetical protein
MLTVEQHASSSIHRPGFLSIVGSDIVHLHDQDPAPQDRTGTKHPAEVVAMVIVFVKIGIVTINSIGIGRTICFYLVCSQSHIQW